MKQVIGDRTTKPIRTEKDGHTPLSLSKDLLVKRSKPPIRGTKPNSGSVVRVKRDKREPVENTRAVVQVGAIATQDTHNRAQPPQPWSERKRLFLRVGDEVSHLRYEQWGIGIVMELMTSSVPGGTCLARVRFQDGQLRCFNNDLDNETCCYYFGVRRYWNPSHGVNAIRSKFFLRG